MEKINVSVVSYANSIPFVQGLVQSSVMSKINLSLDVPSDCALKVLSGKSDLGLVPIAIIPEMNYYEIISDFCLSSNYNARTVIMISNVPLEKIKKVILDNHSRTSVLLARVLAQKYWKINPEWHYATEHFDVTDVHDDIAAVVIGDKAFQVENKFPYQYDLSEIWKQFTSLPFVFACWVANKPLDIEFISEFNCALYKGISDIPASLKANNKDNNPDLNLEHYLTENISYVLDEEKHRAIKLFWNYISELNLVNETSINKTNEKS